MTISRSNIYFIAGVGMIVGSFFAAAKALGAFLALIYFVSSTDFTNADPSIADNISNTFKSTMNSNMVHSICSFLILFLGGRWMLRGPKLLDRWADHNKDADPNTPESN